MKKASVILLMLMFTVSQYATQFNYLECKMANNFKSLSQKCNCEAEVKPIADPGKDSPVSKSHVHHFVDENFTVNTFVIIERSFAGIIELFRSGKNDRIVYGYTDEPFKPPLA